MSFTLRTDFLYLDHSLSVEAALQQFKASDATHIITGKIGRFYLYPRDAFWAALVWYETFAAGQDKTLGDYPVFSRFDFVVTQSVTMPELPSLEKSFGKFVVCASDKPVGYIDIPYQSGSGDYYHSEPNRGPKFGGLGGIDLESFPKSPETEEPTSLPPDTDSATPFEAFPHISDPGAVLPGATFSIMVGFSRERDETLRSDGPIRIQNPAPGDFIEISLSATGADVVNNRLKMLPLDLDANVKFECKAHDNAKEISIVAVFFYKRQSVGTATRVLNGGAPAAPGFDFALPAVTPETTVDVTAIIRWDASAGHLLWSIVGPTVNASDRKKVSDTRAFAANLSTQLDPNINSGTAAYNILTTLGQGIAELIPDAFFAALDAVFKDHKRPPRVLILTDEPYIPWELAYHESLVLDAAVEPFLHLQTCIGRWWLSDTVVMPPPTTLPINRMSVVATDYSDNAGVSAILEAGNEKRFLIDTFKAQPVKADQNSLLQLTGLKPATAGHLLHIALHGISNANLNEQYITLEDGRPLSAEAMIGPYFRKQTPAISFMFLNACQVGTSGSSLGQASGFPGVMLKKGMLGFIAPLWNIDDAPARNFSEQFYKNALGAGRPVGEVLLELRRKVNFQDSITELAYLYYGHPTLTLHKNI